MLRQTFLVDIQPGSPSSSIGYLDENGTSRTCRSVYQIGTVLEDLLRCVCPEEEEGEPSGPETSAIEQLLDPFSVALIGPRTRLRG